MMIKSLFCLILLPLVSIVEGDVPGDGRHMPRPIRFVTAPHVVVIAQFAITQHNMQSKEDLVFVKVVVGTTQVVPNGLKYVLKMEAKNGRGKTKNYMAIVVDKKWELSKTLETFKEV